MVKPPWHVTIENLAIELSEDPNDESIQQAIFDELYMIRPISEMYKGLELALSYNPTHKELLVKKVMLLGASLRLDDALDVFMQHQEAMANEQMTILSILVMSIMNVMNIKQEDILLPMLS